MNPLIKIARTLLAKEVLRGSATALVLKFCGSLLGFVMFALAARNMQASAFGSLVVIFNVMGFLAVLASCGQETLIARSWNEYCESGRPGLARGALLFGAQIVVGAGLATAVAAGVVWSAWDRSVPLALIAAACAFLFALTLMHFTAQYSRVAAGVAVAESSREVVWRLVVTLVILFHHVTRTPFTIAAFFFVAAGALILSVGLQAWRIARVFPREVRGARGERDLAQWLPRAAGMWVSALLETTGQYVDVVAIGYFLGPTPAAYFFVATRITNVFAMISGGVASYATTRISGLFHSGASQQLQGVLRSLSLISAVMAAGAFLVILLGGRLLLWSFGPAYVSDYPALIILAVGAALAALAGPAAYLLLLTGRENTYPRIIACGLVARFALFATLGPWLGLNGAAIGWSVSAVGVAIALVVACRRLLRLDPSLLSASRAMPRTIMPRESLP